MESHQHKADLYLSLQLAHHNNFAKMAFRQAAECLTHSQSRAPVLPARRVSSIKRAQRVCAQATKGEAQDIYIGFEKGDYARPAGRKGRMIKDDPTKYPDKEDIGIFSGVVGGWAGGEAALAKLKEEAAAQKSQKSNGTGKSAQDPETKVITPGKDKIYVGFAKDELELRKSGVKGRFIVDDDRKYPGKEDVGPLAGAVGGFAGGEVGIKSFVQKGEVTLRRTDFPVKKQTSPISLGLLLAAAGAGGGLLLNQIGEVGEDVVRDDIIAAPIDDKTKVLLLAAVAVLAGAGLIAGGRAMVSSVQESVRDNVQKAVVFAGFWIVVFFAARAVLEI